MRSQKLPSKIVKQARTLHAFGLTLSQLAKLYKTTQSTIHRAINGIGKGYASER